MLAVLATLLPTANAASIAAPAVNAGPDGGAATPGVSAIYYNPAAIAPTEGVDVLLDAQASLIGITATATRNDGIDPNTGEAYEPLTANVVVPVGILGVTWKVIPDRLAVGIAAYDPFVGGGKYLEADGSPDYEAHGRYHGISVELLTIAITPAVGVTVVDGLHAGAGVSYVIDHVKALQAADPLGTEGIAPEELASIPPENPYAYDVYLDAEATGHHWAWNAGVLFDRIPQAQIGLSYSSGGTFRAAGDASVEVPAALSTTAQAATIPGKVDFTIKLPPIARLYLTSQLNEKLMVGAGVDYEMWNACCGTKDGDVHIQVTNADGEAIGAEDGVTIDIAKDQYNPSRLWNAAAVSVYGGYQVVEPLWVGARAGYNQYATPSYSVNPVNLDFENVGVQLGARYQLGSVLTLGLTYSHFFLFTREITDSAWDLRDGNERFSPALPYKTSANGTYSGYVNVVGLRVGADF
ncbi:MAG: OmpP1/FadL family transporter [Myxococcota bacterium]